MKLYDDMTPRQKLVEHVAHKITYWATLESTLIHDVKREDFFRGTKGRAKASRHLISVALNSVLDGVKPGTIGWQMYQAAEKMSWEPFVADVRRETTHRLYLGVDYGTSQSNQG